MEPDLEPVSASILRQMADAPWIATLERFVLEWDLNCSADAKEVEAQTNAILGKEMCLVDSCN